MISANSPGLSSVKLGGILPIPVAGDPIYEGLNVIGAVPQTPEEARINGVAFWDYSYLPLIREMRGSVSHAKSDDWSGMAQALVDSAKHTGSIFVTLQNPAATVHSVIINGNRLFKSSFFVLNDGVTLAIRYSSPTNVNLEIQVIYE